MGNGSWQTAGGALHQNSFDTLVDLVLSVAEMAVHVQRVADVADQQRELVGQDVSIRHERNLRGSSTHLQDSDQLIAVSDVARVVCTDDCYSYTYILTLLNYRLVPFLSHFNFYFYVHNTVVN